MSRKNKAARLVNVALGIIVILAVILSSPLFGYGRGLSTPEQREAAASQAEAPSEIYRVQPAASTPRPTPKPTPTPVVLPSAPPTPEPTPQPVYTPAPQVQPQQQYAPPAQQAWAPQPAPEEEYEEEDFAEEESAGSGAAQMQWNDTGGAVTENESGGELIQNDNFDLIFSDQTEVSTAQTVMNETTVEQYTGADPDFQQAAREGEAYFIQ